MPSKRVCVGPLDAPKCIVDYQQQFLVADCCSSCVELLLLGCSKVIVPGSAGSIDGLTSSINSSSSISGLSTSCFTAISGLGAVCITASELSSTFILCSPAALGVGGESSLDFAKGNLLVPSWGLRWVCWLPGFEVGACMLPFIRFRGGSGATFKSLFCTTPGAGLITPGRGFGLVKQNWEMCSPSPASSKYLHKNSQ